MATSNTIQSLRERMQATMKAASANPTDPADKGAAPTPSYPDKAELAKSTPGTENTNKVTTTPEDAGIMKHTNPGIGPTINPTVIQESAAIQKMAALRKRMEELAKKEAAAAPAPAAAPAAPATKVAGTEEPTPGTVDPDVMKVAYDQFAAIGAALCATEEGRQLVEHSLRKQAGEARAAEMMVEATKAAAVLEYAGYEMERIEDEERAKLAFAHEQLSQLTPEEQQAAIKLAEAREDALANGTIKSAAELFFFNKGASMAEAMMPGGASAGADPAAGLPTGGEDAGADPEAILAAVMEAVASGQMSEDEAKALLESYGLTLPGGEAAPAEDPAAKQASAILEQALKVA